MKVIDDFIKDHALLIVKWGGQWDFDEYKATVDSFIEKNKERDIRKIIHDITDLDFTVDMINVKQLAKIKTEKIKKAYKVVYITNKPQDVVFSLLYSEKFKDKYSYLHCTTVKKALELLSVDMSSSDLENRLNLLGNNL